MTRSETRPRQPLRRSVPRLAVAFLLLALVGCDDSGPVEDVFLFEGQLEFEGSVTHSLVTVDEGIARVEVSALRPRLLDVTLSSVIVIGLGLGQPDQAGECATSFRTNARLGNTFSIGLEEETEYCLLVFDSGSLPEDAVIDYTITVSPG